MTAYPPPLHNSRMPWPTGFAEPSAAAGLRKLAEALGWDATLTYALGYVPGVAKDSFVLVHSVAARFSRTLDGGVYRKGFVTYEARADAGKLSWTAKTMMVWGGDHWPVSRGLGVNAVKDYLREGPGWTGQEVGNWATGLKAAAAAKAEKAKERAKSVPRKAKVI